MINFCLDNSIHDCYSLIMDELPGLKLRQLINDILQNGYVIPSSHARTQMDSRNYSMSDVRHIIKNGTYVGADLRDGKYGYTFEGPDIDGHSGIVVVGIDETLCKLIIITVKGGAK